MEIWTKTATWKDKLFWIGYFLFLSAILVVLAYFRVGTWMFGECWGNPFINKSIYLFSPHLL
jgi:hypothetical protein